MLITSSIAVSPLFTSYRAAENPLMPERLLILLGAQWHTASLRPLVNPHVFSLMRSILTKHVNAGLHLMRCLASTQGPKIRVNAVSPLLLRLAS